MKRLFISYRRAESVDIAGRIYDRLMGYFGPSRVFIDVDALLAGVDYPSQIARMLDQCDVVLVIIGRQWLTFADEGGRRRLDDPEDLLRKEVATALQKEHVTVVPILVHGALLPEETELPPAIGGLATKPPIEVRSGIRFNADVTNLIEQLERVYDVRHPDRRFSWEWAVITLGILMMVVATIYFATAFDATLFVQSQSTHVFGEQYPLESTIDHTSNGLRNQAWTLLFASILPAGLGAFLIVFGFRSCCGKKDRDRETAHFLYGLGRRPAYQSGKAVLCLALGLASFGCGWVTGIPALLMGAAAYWEIRRKHGWVRGRLLILQGVLFAVSGGCLQVYVWNNYLRDYYWLVHMENADQLQQAKNTARSVVELETAMSWQPDHAAAYYHRAAIRVQDGRHRLAMADLNQTIDLLRKQVTPSTPTYTPARNWLGTALKRRAEVFKAMGDLEHEKEDLAAADELNPRPETNPRLPAAGVWGRLPAPAPAPAPVPAPAVPMPPAP